MSKKMVTDSPFLGKEIDYTMSGVFGIVDSKRNTRIAPLLTRMGAEMAHREWYVVETHTEEINGVGLGRVGIGIFNREQQPLCSEDGNLMVFLSGEFYNTIELRRALEAKGHRFRDGDDLELVLRLYQEKGKQFVYDLEGAFVLTIWDRTRQELIIANDRFGLYPLFYAHYDSKLVFAPEMKGILCDPGFRKELDLDALDEYVRFQRVLGQKTFFEGLQLLPGASLLLYAVRTDGVTLQHYWDFSKIPQLTMDPRDAAVEAERLLTKAVNRAVAGPHRIGVYLSGGKDSRLVLGLAARKLAPMHSITFGAQECRDVVYARCIAKKVGSVHHFFPYDDGRWVRENADFHLELTEGFHNWVHLHGIDTLEPMRQYIDLQLTGFCGDHLLDSRLIKQVRYSTVQTWDTLAFRTQLFHLFTQRFSWPGLSEGEARAVYAEPIRETVYGRALDSLERELIPFEGYDPIKRLEYFTFANHAMRLTHNYVVFFRSSLEVRYPFLDYAFFDFVCGLPPDIRFGENGWLGRELLNKAVPELALVPVDKDERLLTNHRALWAAHALVQRFKRGFNHYIVPVFPQKATLYADYEGYLRTELREWGESILFGKATLDRGIFDPQFLRSIWARHQSGEELHTIGKIAPMMTYEMMLRRFYD